MTVAGSIADLVSAAEQAFADRAPGVLLDLSACRCADTKVVAALVLLLRKATAGGASLGVIASPAVLQVLLVCRITFLPHEQMDPPPPSLQAAS